MTHEIWKLFVHTFIPWLCLGGGGSQSTTSSSNLPGWASQFIQSLPGYGQQAIQGYNPTGGALTAQAANTTSSELTGGPVMQAGGNYIQNLLGQGGPLYGQETGAVSNILNSAGGVGANAQNTVNNLITQGGGPNVGAAQTTLGNEISGAYLNPETNPAVQAVNQATQAQANQQFQQDMGQIKGGANAAGALFSSGVPDAEANAAALLASNVGQTTANTGLSAYEQNLANQAGATQSAYQQNLQNLVNLAGGAYSANQANRANLAGGGYGAVGARQASAATGGYGQGLSTQQGAVGNAQSFNLNQLNSALQLANMLRGWKGSNTTASDYGNIRLQPQPSGGGY